MGNKDCGSDTIRGPLIVIYIILNQTKCIPGEGVFDISLFPLAQGPEEMCLSLEHQNPSKTSEKMGDFDRVERLPGGGDELANRSYRDRAADDLGHRDVTRNLSREL